LHYKQNYNSNSEYTINNVVNVLHKVQFIFILLFLSIVLPDFSGITVHNAAIWRIESLAFLAPDYFLHVCQEKFHSFSTGCLLKASKHKAKEL
jgi:hypothetical protein